MKEKKFLEQLNLYLDGVIDPAGAAELEQEILANPARRRVYNDYCRIHRATKLVYEQFRAAGAAHVAGPLPSPRARKLAATAAGIAALDGRTGGRAAFRPFRAAIFLGGLAAACAVGVFVGVHALAPQAPKQAAPTPAVADSQPAPAPAVATTQPVKDPDATYKAPVAPEFRSDPYMHLTQSRTDPFALDPGLGVRTDDNNMAQLMPASLDDSLSTGLNVDPRFRPAAQGLETWPSTSGQRAKNPFRLRLDATTPGKPAAFDQKQQ